MFTLQPQGTTDMQVVYKMNTHSTYSIILLIYQYSYGSLLFLNLSTKLEPQTVYE